YYDAVTVNLTLSGEPQLLQNSPNPFNPSTTIKFYTPNTSDVTIRIYDMLGREVTTLINQQTTAGYHIVYWNGKDSRGENVASGIYLYRLTAGSFSETKKMNLLK
ncbi:MAG: T9SS type A sorting domain-containing protein, partial [Ignavibacteriaceae bacterium]